MMNTTPDNGDPLPYEVERLINRKLGLMRRQVEMRLTSVKTEMGRAVETQILEGLNARKSIGAIHVSTLAAYREAAAIPREITAECKRINEGVLLTGIFDS